MQLYRREFELLKKVKSIIASKFPRLGRNKKQETIRFFYEISKKESVSPEAILQDIDSSDFSKIKDALLKRRFPYMYFQDKILEPYLPKIKLDSSSCLNPKKIKLYPKTIFVEKAAQDLNLATRFKKSFSKAKFVQIKSLKDYLKKKRTFRIEDYNKRRDTVFITYENHDFFKKCPCTRKALGCNYHIFNLSFGCLFDCSYCYLQEYANIPGLIFPANINKFFKTFSSYKRPHMRIGTGEFSDSLMLDHITEYSIPIIDFFKKHSDVTFEFKTKSTNIDNLLKTKHSGNIIIAWSLNPQRIIDENELFTPPLKKRLEAALNCVKAGYKVAFHFDPVIYSKNWEKEYEKVIDLIFKTLKAKNIAWISIGTLRFNPKVKQVIEARFPDNKILYEELLPGFDYKLRYPYTIRQTMYESILKMIFKHSKKLTIYLCMEELPMWKGFKRYLTLP